MNNKYIEVFSCSSELRGISGNRIETIGSPCHELGHVLGAQDFYSVNGSGFIGTGDWDLMAGGSWNGHWAAPGTSPAHFNPYTKIKTFGWATHRSLFTNSLTTLHPANSNKDSFYEIPTSTPGEYFLLENRQCLGFDAHLPGHGLIVWHVHSKIEADKYAINTTYPQRLYPVCASATENPDSSPSSYGAINSVGCPFPGTSKQQSLNFTTTPSLRSWAEASTNMDIQFIAEKDNKISFVVNPQISGPATICNEATYTITTAPEGTPIQWNVGNGLSIMSGQGTKTVVVKKTAPLLFLGVGVVEATFNNSTLTKRIKDAKSPGSISAAFDPSIHCFVTTITSGRSYIFYANDVPEDVSPSSILWEVIPPHGFASRYGGSSPLIDFNGGGGYTLRMRWNGPCGTNSEAVRSIFVNGPPAPTDPRLASIYPNPATDQLTVELNRIDETENGIVSMERNPRFAPHRRKHAGETPDIATRHT